MVVRNRTILRFKDFHVNDAVPEFLACEKEVKRKWSSFAKVVKESRKLLVLFRFEICVWGSEFIFLHEFD
jgi:hypothetical protein